MSTHSAVLDVLRSIDFNGSEQEVADAMRDKVLPLLKAARSDKADNKREGPEYVVAPGLQNEILSSTDPFQATAVWIVTLCSRYAGTEVAATEVFQLVGRLFESASELQMKIVGSQFQTLVQIIVSVSDAMGKPELSLKPLLDAALAFSSTHDTLSPAHAMFVAQALKAKQYDVALNLLQYSVDQFDLKYGLTYHDHLLFHYYGAIVFIYTKQYERAFNYLATVLCAPGQATSMIQIEAYKKTVLIQLILTGKRSLRLPRLTSELSSHRYRVAARAYDYFGSGFESNDILVLKTVWNQINAIFEKDGNYGLGVMSLMAFRKQQIQKLQKTFMSLPMAYVESKDTDIEGSGRSTKDLVVSMIDTGELEGILTEQDVIVFKTTAVSGSSLETLQAKLEDVRVLNEKIAAAVRRVGMSREYLARKVQGAGVGGFGRPMGNGGMDMEIEAYDGLMEL
ncbi:hypothetical protein V1512DRAFT_266414 [Lipomyces arxii]|uniref:uncharacterized protein n=1 Tax=Lipomyces arxii TaxID=56418 RepID=UPI0034CFC272